MDFKLTEEQELIRASVREFAQKYLEPIAEEIDEESRYPKEVMDQIAEMDWLGIPFPTEYGGAGADFQTFAIVIEELSRACASTGFTVSATTGLVLNPINLFGTEEQKKKYMIPICKGQKVGAFALTEPGAGTDAGAIVTTAVLDGDEYVINGTKTFISNGPLADVFVVIATSDPAKGAKGMSAFIVPKEAGGISVGKHFKKMGLRASQTSEVIFKDCRIPKENLLGEEGKGFRIAMQTLDGGRLGIAAQSVGILQACLDESIQYAKERVQFGKPISRNQAIQWMIVDMDSDLNAARLLTYYAAYLRDQGLPYGKETATAKLYGAEAANRHATKAVQIHGGIGYMKGTKVERLMRDAKITEIYEGSSEAHRMVIAGNIIR